MRRHHLALLGLTGLLFCQPRAATAHPHKDLVPLLVVPLVEQAPTVDGKSDAMWASMPAIVVDATLKDAPVPVTLSACRTADAWFVRLTWSDPAGDLGFVDGGAGGTKPPIDAVTLRWADAVTAEGKLVPEDSRPGDAGGTIAGVWSGGLWTYELDRPCKAARPNSVEPPGALSFSVADPKRGRTDSMPVRVRPGGGSKRRTFEEDAAGAAAKGFRTALAGKGKPSSWMVRFDAGEAGNRSLVQEVQDEENDRYPLALLEGFTAKDVDLSVRFQARKGFKDRAAGVVWRAKDEKNHYILRANMLEGNVVLYKMQDGLRIDLPPVGHESDYGVNVEVDPDAWHTLRMTAVGDRFQAYLNGRLLFDVVDTTFPDAGGVGLWTKSDSVIAFDDVLAVPLDPPKGG